MTTYTDAEFTFTVDGLDMTSIDQPHLTVKQDSTVIDVTNITPLSSNAFTVRLTQQQTAMLKFGKDAKVQLNFFAQGLRKNTKIKTIPVDENLLKRVLTNE